MSSTGKFNGICRKYSLKRQKAIAFCLFVFACKYNACIINTALSRTYFLASGSLCIIRPAMNEIGTDTE